MVAIKTYLHLSVVPEVSKLALIIPETLHLQIVIQIIEALRVLGDIRQDSVAIKTNEIGASSPCI